MLSVLHFDFDLEHGSFALAVPLQLMIFLHFCGQLVFKENERMFVSKVQGFPPVMCLSSAIPQEDWKRSVDVWLW